MGLSVPILKHFRVVIWFKHRLSVTPLKKVNFFTTLVAITAAGL